MNNRPMWISPNKLRSTPLPIIMTENLPYLIVKIKIRCLPASWLSIVFTDTVLMLQFCLPYIDPKVIPKRRCSNVTFYFNITHCQHVVLHSIFEVYEWRAFKRWMWIVIFVTVYLWAVGAEVSALRGSDLRVCHLRKREMISLKLLVTANASR